jgi:hypothetical protein
MRSGFNAKRPRFANRVEPEVRLTAVAPRPSGLIEGAAELARARAKSGSCRLPSLRVATHVGRDDRVEHSPALLIRPDAHDAGRRMYRECGLHMGDDAGDGDQNGGCACRE